MLITARIRTTCPTCDRPVDVGERAHWTKGERARHEACPPPPECPVCGKRHSPFGMECDGDDDPWWIGGDW